MRIGPRKHCDINKAFYTKGARALFPALTQDSSARALKFRLDGTSCV